MLTNFQNFRPEIAGGLTEIYYIFKSYIDKERELDNLLIDFGGVHYFNPDLINSIKITMWETTRLHLNLALTLNKNRALFVPSLALMYIFSASGVNRPIEIFDGFIDDCYSYRDHIKKDKLIIGLAYNINFTRKNQYFAIECFLEAFKGNQDVELWIKTNEELKTEEKNIKVFNGFLTKEQMLDWYEQIDVSLSTSRAEGIGLFNLQSMACGRPIITNNFLTVGEYANENNSFIIPHTLISPTDHVFGKAGLWADMKKEDVVYILKKIYNNKNLIYNISKKASDDVKKYKASIAAPKLIQQLKKYV